MITLGFAKPLLLLVSYIGFQQTTLEFTCAERFAGQRSYTVKQSFKMAAAGLMGFSGFGLNIPIYLGCLGLLGALVYVGSAIVRHLSGSPLTTPGWLSLIIIMTFVLAFNMIYLGVIGTYLNKIFIEVKRRPTHFVAASFEHPSRQRNAVASESTPPLWPENERPKGGIEGAHFAPDDVTVDRQEQPT